MNVTTVDAHGAQRTEHRRLRPAERLVAVLLSVVGIVLGASMVAGAILGSGRHLARITTTFFTGLFAVMAVAGGAALVWHAQSTWRRGPAGSDVTDGGDREVGLDVTARMRAAVSAFVLARPLLTLGWAGLLFALAVFLVVNLPASWRDEALAVERLVAVLSTADDALTLIGFLVGVVLVVGFLVHSMSVADAGGAGAALLLLALMGVGLLIAWPLGMLDGWFDVLRWAGDAFG